MVLCRLASPHTTFALDRVVRAAAVRVECGGEIRLGWHNDVDAFSERIDVDLFGGDDSLIGLLDKGIALRVAFGDGIKKIFVTPFFVLRLFPCSFVARVIGIAKSIPGANTGGRV